MWISAVLDNNEQKVGFYMGQKTVLDYRRIILLKSLEIIRPQSKSSQLMGFQT